MRVLVLVLVPCWLRSVLAILFSSLVRPSHDEKRSSPSDSRAPFRFDAVSLVEPERHRIPPFRRQTGGQGLLRAWGGERSLSHMGYPGDDQLTSRWGVHDLSQSAAPTLEYT